jgi:hypothetical protein
LASAGATGLYGDSLIDLAPSGPSSPCCRSVNRSSGASWAR